MTTRVMTEQQAQNVNALVLAYVGDAVQSLYVRSKLAFDHDCKAHDMHKMASDEVNAHAQALQAKEIFPLLTQEEKDVYMRARNAKTRHRAKNRTLSDYKKATAVEAVLGYLYLTGKTDRLKTLLEV